MGCLSITHTEVISSDIISVKCVCCTCQLFCSLGQNEFELVVDKFISTYRYIKFRTPFFFFCTPPTKNLSQYILAIYQNIVKGKDHVTLQQITGN